MQHKNVVALSVLALVSLNIHASKPSACKWGKACVVKSTVTSGVNKVENSLNNSHVNAASNAIVLGSAAYATYKYGPDFFKQVYELAQNRFAKKTAAAQASTQTQLPSSAQPLVGLVSTRIAEIEANTATSSATSSISSPKSATPDLAQQKFYDRPVMPISPSNLTACDPAQQLALAEQLTHGHPGLNE